MLREAWFPKEKKKISLQNPQSSQNFSLKGGESGEAVVGGEVAVGRSNKFEDYPRIFLHLWKTME